MRAVVLRYSGERVVHLLNIPTTQYPHYSISPLLNIPTTQYPHYSISPLLNIPTTQYPHYSIASHSCVTGKNCILELFVSSDDRTVTYQ